MKISVIVILSVLLAGSASAQRNSAQFAAAKPSPQQQTAAPQSGTPSVTQSQIDPAKEADIQRLLEVSGAKANMLEVMNTMEKNIRPMMTNSLPPGDYREKLIDLFFDKFQSRMRVDMLEILNQAVPIYDKYFSDEDIKGLIRFYETPLGKKATAELPKLMSELQSQGMKLGEKTGRDSMTEVLAEHPELKQALEDAARNARPRAPGNAQ